MYIFIRITRMQILDISKNLVLLLLQLLSALKSYGKFKCELRGFELFNIHRICIQIIVNLGYINL